MIILLLISILLVALYTGAAIWTHKELPDSVSSMVYYLPKHGKWFWTVWIWAATYTLTPALFEVIPENFGVIAHAFATSVLFVGAMPLVKDESNKAHNVLGISAGIFSQLCVLLICPWCLALWGVMGILMAVCVGVLGKNCIIPKFLNGKGVFVAEVICYITIVTSLLIHSSKII